MWEPRLLFGYFFCVHLGDGVNICQGCVKKKSGDVFTAIEVKVKSSPEEWGDNQEMTWLQQMFPAFSCLQTQLSK